MEYDTIIHRKADGGPGRMVMVCTEGAGQAGTDGLFDRGRQKGWEGGERTDCDMAPTKQKKTTEDTKNLTIAMTDAYIKVYLCCLLVRSRIFGITQSVESGVLFPTGRLILAMFSPESCLFFFVC